ncbi:MAG: hypothetical protein AB1411_08780 [Nitrospirota bacterium]
MPRQAKLFEQADGSVLKGYRLIRRRGANIPPMWIERATESRRRLHGDVARALQRGRGKGALGTLRAWEERYRKECFYYGLRVLLELERRGKTKY